MLRGILFRLANSYRSNNAPKSVRTEIDELLMAVHYQHMYYSTKALGLKDLAAKCAITLLKYPDILPQDKAFYQAGIACREQGNANIAFMLLNRYVDLAEAIDAQDPSYLDNADYHDTDTIPLQAALPQTQYIRDENTREDVRTWVLSIVTDSSIEQRFPPRERARNYFTKDYSQRKGHHVLLRFPVHPADLLK